jgi:hypothetical protein
VLVALKLQGVTSITAQQAASQLYYDGGRYSGRRDPNRTWHTLEKKAAGWFVWHKWMLDANGQVVHAH